MKMFSTVFLFLYTLACAIAADTYTACGQYPYPLTVLTSGTCTENYYGYVPTAVSMISETDTTISSYWLSTTGSVKTSIAVITLTFRLFQGAGYVLIVDCSYNRPAWCLGENPHVLSNTYVTTYIASPTALVTTTTTTVTEAGSGATVSVCEGSDGIVTRYTTGPVAGTSTVITCSSL